MNSKQTKLARNAAKTRFGIALCFSLVAVLSSEKLYGVPPEANVLFEVQIAPLRDWSMANELRTEQVVGQKKADGSVGLLSSLFNAERIQAGIQLGFMTGEPTQIFGQLKFSSGVDAKQFLECVADNSPGNGEAIEHVLLKPIDGLPPLHASSVSDKSISLFSSGMEKVSKKSFLTMADTPQWTDSGKSGLRIAINVEAFRAVLSQILVGSVASSELKDEMQSCLDNCDRLYASLTPGGDELVKLVAVAPNTSSAKKLRTRVDGLLFLLRTKLTAFLNESSTGNEAVDDAVQEVVSELAANHQERAVEVVISRSDQTQLIVKRLIEVVNASTSQAVEIERPDDVIPE